MKRIACILFVMVFALLNSTMVSNNSQYAADEDMPGIFGTVING